jgi:hypothetical protein
MKGMRERMAKKKTHNTAIELIHSLKAKDKT